MSLCRNKMRLDSSCLYFALLFHMFHLTVSYGGIEKSKNSKELAQSLPLPTLNHCESSSGPLLVHCFKKKVVSAIVSWLIVCVKTARFWVWRLPTWPACEREKADLRVNNVKCHEGWLYRLFNLWWVCTGTKVAMQKVKAVFFLARVSRINCNLVHEVRSKQIAKMP